jgi:hypothetical protein
MVFCEDCRFYVTWSTFTGLGSCSCGSYCKATVVDAPDFITSTFRMKEKTGHAHCEERNKDNNCRYFQESLWSMMKHFFSRRSKSSLPAMDLDTERLQEFDRRLNI